MKHRPQLKNLLKISEHSTPSNRQTVWLTSNVRVQRHPGLRGFLAFFTFSNRLLYHGEEDLSSNSSSATATSVVSNWQAAMRPEFIGLPSYVRTDSFRSSVEWMSIKARELSARAIIRIIFMYISLPVIFCWLLNVQLLIAIILQIHYG